jgi:hypothetical protein
MVREMKPGENTRLLLLMPTSGGGARFHHGVTPKDARAILERIFGIADPVSPPSPSLLAAVEKGSR